MKYIFELSRIAFIFCTVSANAGQLKLSPLTPTIYYIQTISAEENCENKKSIVDDDGVVIAKVCKQSYKLCVVEGTCAVINEENESQQMHLINYYKMNSKNVPLFKKVDTHRCPFGYGVKNICLDPYFSIAADLDIYKPGMVIFVPSLKGLLLPNGETHDGFLVIRDKGGAIEGEGRFDFFTGFIHYKDEANAFTPIGLANKKSKLEFRMATNEETQETLKERNFPYLPESALGM